MKDTEAVYKIEITFKTILFTIGTIILIMLLAKLLDLFVTLFMAFILMSALKPSVDWLEKKGLPRIISAVLLLFGALSIIVVIFVFAVPPLVAQTKDFFVYGSRQLLVWFQQLTNQTLKGDAFPIQSLTQYIPNITTIVTHTITSLFTNVFQVITLFFFTLYLTLGMANLENLLRRILPEKKLTFVMETIHTVEQRLGAWVRGELILMCIIGIMSYIGLSALGIQYALPLAVIAGALEVFPIIGPTLSAVPAFFVAASISWFLGLAIIALYIIIQQLENNLIVPVVMKHSVGIPPLALLISLIVGQKIAGYSGMLLSVPFVAAMTIIVKEIVLYRGNNS